MIWSWINRRHASSDVGADTTADATRTLSRHASRANRCCSRSIMGDISHKRPRAIPVKGEVRDPNPWGACGWCRVPTTPSDSLFVQWSRNCATALPLVLSAVDGAVKLTRHCDTGPKCSLRKGWIVLSLSAQDTTRPKAPSFLHRASALAIVLAPSTC